MPADRTVDSSSQSAADSLSSRSKAAKKLRTPGACDLCKRRKGDSANMPGNRCSNCVVAGMDCTHEEVLKNLRTMREYVEVLEERLKKMDELLNKAMPGINTSTLEKESSIQDTGNKDTLTSGHQLFQTALEVKEEYIAEHGLRKEGWYAGKRQEFWEIPSWMVPHPKMEDTPLYIFPEYDLLVSLVDLYFTHCNPYLPLLHRPIFERSLEKKDHLLDHNFGGTVMLVCALGSCYSNDPRVFMDGNGSTTSAGWKWYSQVNILRKSFYKRTSLYELQTYALSVMYIHPSHASDGVWTQVGMGLRLATEVGAHRKRKTPGGRPNAENELWKRAFWVLLCLDRTLSLFYGRPYGIHEEDFDLDLPVDCDDEYWDQGFTQPLGKSSKISYFVNYIKLCDILASAMKTIYPIRKTEKVAGKPVDFSVREIIADLDSTMNNWMDSLPAYLRWNPSCTDDILLRQSAALHAQYYDLQIFIHRPFIPSPRNPQPGAFPSLAICANAARLCFHVLECFNKSNAVLLPQLHSTAVHTAIILLLNIWSGKISGMAPNQQRDMEDVQRCMRLLKVAEQRPGAEYISDSGYSTQNSTTSQTTPESLPSFDNSPKSTIQGALHPQVQGMDILPVHTMELGSLPIYGQSSFKGIDATHSYATDNISFPDHTASQNFQTRDSTKLMGGESQNLFVAADDFMKNTLFGGQAAYNNSFYFSPHHSLVGFNEDDISLIFGSQDVGNMRQNADETSTSAAASIFAAYDMSWDHLQRQT
ncbi:fungal-specific transcription factor domain-containing protein [Cyathus striatus]|nr:fungal-specific transcription factor domain-containing protein [Cyathus striatus]